MLGKPGVIQEPGLVSDTICLNREAVRRVFGDHRLFDLKINNLLIPIVIRYNGSVGVSGKYIFANKVKSRLNPN